MQLLRRLDFNDDLVVNDHVEDLPHERLAAKVHYHGNLARYMMSLRHQIALECRGVDRFSVTKPETAMYLVHRSDN